MTRTDDIIEQVDQKELNTVEMRDRMDRDYDLWSGAEYQGAGAGYQQYTSNEPRTYAQKTIGVLNGASMSVEVPQGNDDRQTRDQDNAKEQFVLGNMKANDERLALLDQPPLRASMAWQVAIRGRSCGRALLQKRGERVWADATPWDPRNVMWEMGDEGLLWVCHKYFKTRSQVERNYRVGGRQPNGAKSNDLVTVYDYYDEELNTFIAPAVQEGPLWETPHQVGRVPAWNVASTLQPLVLAPLTASSTHMALLGSAMKDYGDSIYAANRSVYETHNFMMSVLKELAARSRKPVFGIRSRDGIKLVEGDIFKSGSELPLAEGEELIIYDMLKSAPDLAIYESVVSGEMQRGAFPVIYFGESPGVISGFAMHTLKSGVADKVIPLSQAMGVALRQVANLWVDHFVAGGFGDSIRLSGRGSNRKWFSSAITVESLRDLPAVEIELTPQLPEDNASKVSMARTLLTPGPDGMPILSHHAVLEDVLERQNSDQDMDVILQEMAGIDPLTQAARMADALAKQGDEGAGYWQLRFQLLANQMMATLAAMSLPSGAAGSEGSKNGMGPETLPNSGQGKEPPIPGIETPFQSGPNVPPNSPRPGARR